MAGTSPAPEDVLDPPGDPESVARTICLRALTQRARTRAELAALLARRGVPSPAATTVLDRFVDVGLIDDAALAESFAASAHAERGLSRRAVAAKLRQRGVADSDVDVATAHIDTASEYAAAHALAVRKLRSLSGMDPTVQSRRLVAMLARRGYGASLSSRVVREVLGVQGPDVFDGSDVSDG
jgi:regulatory protein